MTLVTHQTGPEGRKVSRLLIEQGLPIARELYLGIVIDRASGKPVIMASQDGGMEIDKQGRGRDLPSARALACSAAKSAAPEPLGHHLQRLVVLAAVEADLAARRRTAGPRA